MSIVSLTSPMGMSTLASDQERLTPTQRRLFCPGMDEETQEWIMLILQDIPGGDAGKDEFAQLVLQLIDAIPDPVPSTYLWVAASLADISAERRAEVVQNMQALITPRMRID